MARLSSGPFSLTEPKLLLCTIQPFRAEYPIRRDTIMPSQNTIPQANDARLFDRENERRRNPRHSVDDLATIQFSNQKLSCRIHDLSIDGAQLEFSTVQVPDRFILFNFKTNRKSLAQVVWRDHLRVGVRFISTPKIFSDGFD